MGLDTTHDCWHGSYSGFNAWRTAIAKTVGIRLSDMRGFGGGVSWRPFKKDVLCKLLHHSDCDGKIKHKHTKKLSKRLISVIPLLESDRMIQKTKQFADGLMLAHVLGEDVLFH